MSTYVARRGVLFSIDPFTLQLIHGHLFRFIALRRLETEITALARRSRDFDFPMLRFIFFDVVLQRQHQRFGMLRGHDDPGINLGAGDAGQQPAEIDDELSGGMVDDRQVGINAFRLLRRQVDVDLLLPGRGSCFISVLFLVALSARGT